MKDLRNADSEEVRTAVNALPPTVAVIVVAYDSEPVLRLCVQALAAQSRRPDAVIIVDNNSRDGAYLREIELEGNVTVMRNAVNEGFCGANNRGYRRVRGYDYVVFLNPDAFPEASLIERATEWMERQENAGVGVLTGTLLGFDIVRRVPSGAVDSTGVFQTWYGKWYDRRQGEAWRPGECEEIVEDLPAVTGALMFCRSRALATVLSPNDEVFDGKFFMYKEDIDLSLRLRKRGWRLVYRSTLLCYHGRGWRGRRAMSTVARYRSARNELRVCFRNRGKGLLFSMLKLLFVPIEDCIIKLSRR